MKWLASEEYMQERASRDAGPTESVLAREGGAYSREGDVAVIKVEGVLTKEPDFWSAFFGYSNTTYSDILEAIDKSVRDPRVKSVRLEVDSPGGQVAGLFRVLDEIHACDKPVTALVTGTAASAAYAIASQADKILVSDRACVIGSIGVVVDSYVDPRRVSISSTEAPKKRPDLSTEEGRSIVREQLDEIHDMFVSAIARGRGIDPKKVNTEFGKGGTMMSDKAILLGMVDGYHSPQTEETVCMNEEIENERARCVAHLKLAEASGCYETAVKAIESGEAITDSILAAHHAAALTKAIVDTRAQDNPSAPISVATSAKELDPIDLLLGGDD